jgi:hypothetical protein
MVPIEIFGGKMWANRCGSMPIGKQKARDRQRKLKEMAAQLME